MQRFDTIIVGGGIAGLLTALRLSQSGLRVVVIEKDKLGSGATLANQGVIHSGALYVRHHGHIVRQCQEAQSAFLAFAPAAEISAQKTLLLTPPDTTKEFMDMLSAHKLNFDTMPINEVQEIETESLQGYSVLSFEERVFSSRQILQENLVACLANGVTILTGTSVDQLIYSEDKVRGVTIGLNQVIESDNVVLAAGLGMASILQSFNSHYSQFFTSRLTTMVYLPHASISRGMVIAAPGKPSIAPARRGALAALFGDMQPPIQDDRKFSVKFSKSQELISGVNEYFDHKSLDTRDAIFYTCGKTDYAGNVTAAKGRNGRPLDPGFQVIDHATQDKISGLYSVLPGKMTLAFHASKVVTEHILKEDVDLIITQTNHGDAVLDNRLAVEPWASL